MEKKDGQGFGCLAALLLALALLIGIGWVSYVREERELRQKSYEELHTPDLHHAAPHSDAPTHDNALHALAQHPARQ